MLMRIRSLNFFRKYRFMSTIANTMEVNKVQVDISQGRIVGVENKLPNGLPFYSFKGIPYAEPPIGNLRFAAPKPLAKFNDPVLDCSKERDVCYHRDFLSGPVGSEDCLFLNVYTPNLDGAKDLPVMIWIHGGAFAAGSGDSEYYSPEYLVEQNVIVVTLNYRLSILGFLCLPEAGIYGNAGLKDQRLAMQWVQQNIEKFNGNPNNVTLFGESAGAACVHLHTLSPGSQKYFHKAICQSGNAVMEWVIGNSEEKSKNLAKCLGCNDTDQRKMLEHLQSISDMPTLFKQYFNTLSADERRRGLPIAFKPTIEQESDEAIITKSPIELMRDSANSSNIPIMMGYNSKDGLVMFTDLYKTKKVEQVENDLARLIPKSLNLAVDDQRIKVVEQKMRDFYLNGRKIDQETYDEVTDLLTDYHFSIFFALGTELHAKYQRSPLYFYRFSVDMELNLYKRFSMQVLGKQPSDRFKGACHADEIYYLFKFNKYAVNPKDFPAAEAVLRRTCTLWTNFAKYGNPTPDDSFPKWNPIDKSAFAGDNNHRWDYMAMENDKLEMRTNPDHERIEFWRKLYDEYNNGILKANL